MNSFNKVFEKKLKELKISLKEQEKECAKELIEEIKSRAKMPLEYSLLPEDFYKYPDFQHYLNYISNWKIEDMSDSTGVVNDYSVYWKRIGKDIAFGYFVEWGIGTLGNEDGNPYAYSYTTEPWDKATEWQQTYGANTPYDPNALPVAENSLFGARAVPHIFPSVIEVKTKTIRKLKDKYE